MSTPADSPQRPVDLDLEVFPRGDRFPMGIYSPAPDQIEELHSAGFNLFGPTYLIDDDQLLDWARGRDAKVVYSVGFRLPEERDGLDEESLRAEIVRQVRRVSDRDEIAWWYLLPEELTHWREQDVAYLELATEAIRASDPERRPILHYSPTHWAGDELAKLVPHLDFVAKGTYPNHSGYEDSRVYVRWSIGQELAAARATESDPTPLAVVEMFSQPTDVDRDDILRWTRHDVYASLVTGARGVLVFSGARRKHFSAHDAYLEAYMQLASELCGPPGLGRVFLFGTVGDTVDVTQKFGPSSVPLKIRARRGVVHHLNYDALLWRELVHGARRYLFVVNSADEAVVAEVAGIGASCVLDHCGGTEPDTVGAPSFDLHLGPAGVACLEVLNTARCARDQ